MARLEVDVKQLHVLTARVERDLTQIGSTMRAIARYQEKSVKRNFELERSPEGKPWQQLEAATLKRKKGSGILRESGDLMDSITVVVSGLKATLESRLVYSATHQYGDTSRGIPQREYMGVSQEDEKELIQIVRKDVKKLLKQYGR